MDWGALQWLRVLADEGAVAPAAHRLSVAPSTLYRRLDQLEDELGLPLFHRDQGRLEPTAAGRATLAVAHEVQGRVGRLERELGALRGGEGRLVLAVPEAMALWVLEALRAFRGQQPDVDVRVVVAQDFAAVERGEADVALRVSDRPGDSLVGRRVGPVELGVYGRSAPEGPFQVAEHDWVCFDHTLADTGQGRWEAHHVPAERVRLRTRSRTLFLEAVKAGHGVGLLPCALAERHGLVCQGPRMAPEDLTLWVLCAPASREDVAVKALMAFLVEALTLGPPAGDRGSLRRDGTSIL